MRLQLTFMTQVESLQNKLDAETTSREMMVRAEEEAKKKLQEEKVGTITISIKINNIIANDIITIYCYLVITK